MSAMPDLRLYPPIEPLRSGMLEVDDLHALYWEESGNPQGVPLVFLHGGPGGEASPLKRRFFDPSHYRIVLFDQRGAGRSRPLGECRRNTLALLVADIEGLRRMLGIDAWLVCGGSWGSTLALAYGQAYPRSCTGFILRGVLLGTQAEIDWFLHGIRLFFPEEREAFVNWLPERERDELLQAYRRRLFSGDPALELEAAQRWRAFTTACSTLRPDPDAVASSRSDPASLGVGKLHAHYLHNRMFLEEGQLLREVGRIAHLPCMIVQGRYDVLCPPHAAWSLHRAWPGSRLRIIDDAGHSPSEAGTQAALLEAAEAFRLRGSFR